MKRLVISAIALALAACSSHPPKKIAIGDAASPFAQRVADSSGLRYAENVREYRFGRYVDPSDPLVMHDAHPVYRVEETATWNLRPTATPDSDRSASAPPIPGAAQRDAELAELNKQRNATRAFTEQTAALNQRLAELAKAAANTQEVAKQNILLKQEMESIRTRLDALQEQARRAQSESSPRPSASRDDQW